jgi:Amidohydrolase family
MSTSGSRRQRPKAAQVAGRGTAAHAEGRDGILNALRAGVDSIEHGSYLDDEALGLMRERNVAYVPTYAVRERIVREGRGAGVPEFIQAEVERAFEAHTASVRRARAAGVPIVMGTDAGATLFPHGQSGHELAAYVRLGLSPMDARRAAARPRGPSGLAGGRQARGPRGRRRRPPRGHRGPHAPPAPFASSWSAARPSSTATRSSPLAPGCSLITQERSACAARGPSRRTAHGGLTAGSAVVATRCGVSGRPEVGARAAVSGGAPPLRPPAPSSPCHSHRPPSSRIIRA